jgi:hypothetical protein
MEVHIPKQHIGMARLWSAVAEKVTAPQPLNLMLRQRVLKEPLSVFRYNLLPITINADGERITPPRGAIHKHPPQRVTVPLDLFLKATRHHPDVKHGCF